jgi:hypothetical protein
MPYAHITEFDFGDDRNTVNYDALGARLFDLGQPVGAIHHSAGFDDNGVFRMYEVWESLDQRMRFIEQTLQIAYRRRPRRPQPPVPARP